MFSPEKFRTEKITARIEQTVQSTSPLLFATLIIFFLVRGFSLIQLSNGGSDLVDADIPKSLMILRGQNPYLTQPWASPYPPLLLLVDSGIIRLTTLFTAHPSIEAISQNLRLAGLFSDVFVGFTIYLYLRSRTQTPITPLVSAGFFLTLPALGISPLYFFHSDTFGYPILGLALVALASHKHLIGTSLLAIATIFKIHPLLAIPLVLIWIMRNNGLRKALPSITVSATILIVGLGLPITIPGYSDSILGFNLSNTGNGTIFADLLAFAQNVLPLQMLLAPSTLLANQIWIGATFAAYTIVIGVVWHNARRLNPIDVVLLGLFAWLIPLKVVYTHYVVWGIIPLLMRGQLKQTVPLLGLLQAADTLSYWLWWPNTSPIPALDSFTSSIIISALYRSIGFACLGFILYSTRQRRVQLSVVGSDERNKHLERNRLADQKVAPIIG